MNPTKPLTITVAAMLMLAIPAAAQNPATIETAKSLADTHAKALVTVKASIKIQPILVDGPDALKDQLANIPAQDQKTETVAITVDPSGIVAAPLSLLDPSSMVGEISTDTPMGPIILRMSTSFSSVQIVDSEGEEQEAEIVMTDQSKGVVFLQLLEPEGTYPSVKVSEEKLALESFDSLVFLKRLGPKFGYEPTINRGNYVRTLTQPSTFFAFTGVTPDPGAVAFDSSGNFAGLSVFIPSEGDPQIAVLPQSEMAPLVAKIVAAE